jgi:hypothetical protein
MKLILSAACVFLCYAPAHLRAAEASPTSASIPVWDPASASAYLDGRINWWMNWPTAARDHGTFCVSCHTAVTYAIARPALRTSLSETSPSAGERQLLDNVTKRVRLWAEVEPFYPDKVRGVPKTAESRGTESILNALILVRSEASNAPLTPDARLALDQMWSEQLSQGDAKGAWSWLQFHNAPWEGDSQYFGAVLGAIAVGSAPESYRAAPEVQTRLQMLREYLAKNRATQTLLDRVMLLWASTRIPDLLTPAETQSLIMEASGKQNPDGGFSLSSFVGDWKRKDGTALEKQSDGYATGVVAFVLQETGMPRNDLRVKRALAWLDTNQQKADGRWLAYSLNKQRDLATDVGRFMSDAATAYAVMALTHANASR